MNFRTLFTISFILSAYLMSAQSPTMQRGSYLGLTAGVGSVWLMGQYNYGMSDFSGVAHTAYMGGILGGVTLKGGHGIHGEVVFSLQKNDYRDIWNIEEQEYPVVVDKKLNFTYLRIPLTYRRIIGIKNGDTDIGDSKFFWGAGIEIGALYNLDLEYTINGEPNDRYIFTENLNPCYERDSDPPNYLDLFNPMDVAATGSFGWERFLAQHIVFQAEMKGTISVLDINRPKWRFKSRGCKYTPSRHTMLYFKCSLIYYVNKVKRLDVY